MLSVRPLYRHRLDFQHMLIIFEDYYQTTLYAKLGITGNDVLLLSGIYGTLGVLINIVSVSLSASISKGCVDLTNHK